VRTVTRAGRLHVVPRFTPMAVAACALFGVTAPSARAVAPRAQYSAQASQYQNRVIAAALQTNPSGTRIAPDMVEWNNDSVLMTVPTTSDGAPGVATATAATVRSKRHRATAAATGGCPTPNWLGEGYYWECVYNQVDWHGTRLQFKDAGYYQDLWSYGGNSWHTESWSQTRGQRSWLNQYANHNSSGASLCMSGNAAGSDTASLSASWDRWIYLSDNYAHC
jgi:hypothetical protein